jgi:hypothetical protein
VDFRTFGAAGNIYRHQYGAVDYGIVWDDLQSSPDLIALEQMLHHELRPST